MRLIIFIHFIFMHFVKSNSGFNFYEQYFDTDYKDVDNSEQKLLHNDLNNKYILLIGYENKKFKPIARIRYVTETKEIMAKNEMTMNQHKARMTEIINFMKDHLLTTMYLYDEIKRIQRDNRIKDDLREMVSYLEKPQNREVKELVLTFFDRNKKKKPRNSIWDQKTNDLVINVIKDPFNDGTIN